MIYFLMLTASVKMLYSIIRNTSNYIKCFEYDKEVTCQ